MTLQTGTTRPPLQILLMVLAALLLLPGLARAQGTTYSEYNVTHDETVGGSLVQLSAFDPGTNAGPILGNLGTLVGTYGDHTLVMRAEVAASADNRAQLFAEVSHDFVLSGVDPTTDVWETTASNVLAQAELVDQLSFGGVPGTSATVELYWQITGQSDAVIDITPPGDILFGFDAEVRLDTAVNAPHSGAGSHTDTTQWGGYRFQDLTDSQYIDSFVMVSHTIDPTQPVDLTVTFEVETDTSLRNGVEIKGLNTTGVHRSNFYDFGAELIGVVIRNVQGTPLPNATITGTSGYDYPVESDIPTPRPPDKVILSPVAVADSDLGEYAGSAYTLMLDQSGLVVPFTSGVTGFNTHFSQSGAKDSASGAANNWQSSVSTPLPLMGYVDFDLGQDVLVDRLAIWNISLEDFRVQVSDTPVGPWTEVGQYSLPSSIWTFGNHQVDILDLGGEHPARYVRLAVDSVHTAFANDTFGYAIVGEVAASAQPVPEPGQMLMLGAGLTTLVLLGRRRDRRGLVPARTTGRPVRAAARISWCRLPALWMQTALRARRQAADARWAAGRTAAGAAQNAERELG